MTPFFAIINLTDLGMMQYHARGKAVQASKQQRKAMGIDAKASWKVSFKKNGTCHFTQ
jgi:hypothetical protein